MKRTNIFKTILTSLIVVATMSTISMAKELPITRKGYTNAERLSKITKYSNTTLQTADIVPMEYEIISGYIAESGPKLNGFKPDLTGEKFAAEAHYVNTLVSKTGHYDSKHDLMYANVPVYKVRDKVNKEVFYISPLMKATDGTFNGNLIVTPILPKMPKEYKAKLTLDKVYFSDYLQALVIREDVINDSWNTKDRKRVIDYFNESGMKPLKRLKTIEVNGKKVMPENVYFEDIHKIPYDVLLEYASTKINTPVELWTGGKPYMILRKRYTAVPKGSGYRDFYAASPFGKADDYMYEELLPYDDIAYSFADGLSEKDKKDGYEFYKKLFNMPKSERDMLLEEIAIMISRYKTGI